MSSSSTNLLPASLQNSLQDVVKLCNQSGAQLRAITLSTTEGVPLGRVYSHHNNHDDHGDGSSTMNEETLMLMETVWAPPSKHLPILLGNSNNNNNNNNNNNSNNSAAKSSRPLTTTAIYNHGCLVHVYWAPVMVVSLFTAANGNLGTLRSTGIPLLQEILAPLRQTLTESLMIKGEDDDDEDEEVDQEGVLVVEQQDAAAAAV
mmetsp:Transcript_21923/g.50508  ORF Transcript_21923/g.50508 Transcript_21923/m.50508 type:complete len:204 (-) Transcript_21923:238-849(-)